MNKNTIIPIFATVIVLIQMIESNTSCTSRWKGGGFGMYSEFHLNQRELWVTFDSGISSPAEDLSETVEAAKLETLCGKCVKYGRTADLKALQIALRKAEIQASRIELWEPAFNISTGTLTRRKLASSHP